jgi:hypothetical protein
LTAYPHRRSERLSDADRGFSEGKVTHMVLFVMRTVIVTGGMASVLFRVCPLPADHGWRQRKRLYALLSNLSGMAMLALVLLAGISWWVLLTRH